MCSRNEDDGPVRAFGRNAERVALALDDERRHGDRVELGQSALGRILSASRRVYRKRKAEHRDGTDFGGRPAGNASARRPSAAHHRQPAELAIAELSEHAEPRGVELVRRCRTAPARHPVRLLDEHDADPGRERSVLRRDEIRRLHTAARTVSEHERRRRLVDLMDVRPRGTERSLQLEDEPSLATHRGTPPRPALHLAE
jgi:hypothetical protein